MSERIIKTLWLLECREGRYGCLFTFYAQDEQEAEDIVQRYLEIHHELYKRSLTCRPHGFTIMYHRMPGQITCKE